MTSKTQPNILLIMTDQHRLSALGAYGETPCRTPHLDGLASRGVLFKNAYTTSPLCSPARASVLTGAWPHRHGITSNTEDMISGAHCIKDHRELLPRRMQALGYQTGYTGKWHIGNAIDDQVLGKYPAPWKHEECLPKTFGFEGQNFSGHGDGGFQYPEYQDYLKGHGWKHQQENGVLTGPVESTEAYFLASHTMSLMDEFQNKKEPFFIWHNFWGPHEPYLPTKQYMDMYRDVEIPAWPNYHWPARDLQGPHQATIHPHAEGMSWENDWEPMVRRYYAFMTMIDDQIGRMVEHMKACGVFENTIIVFTADHGETCGSHGGLLNKGFHHFEEIQRIPMLVSGCGVPEGVVRDELVSLADINPSLFECGGGHLDDVALELVQGRSWAPLLNKQSDVPWRDALLVEFDGLGQCGYTMRTLRRGNLKYGMNIAHRDELYDLARDPWETRNLLDHPEYKDKAQEMRSALLEWMLREDDQALCGLRRKLEYYGLSYG